MWSDKIILLFAVAQKKVWCSALDCFCSVVHFEAFFLLKCPFWVWYCCTLADNFCSRFDFSEPCKLNNSVTAAKSTSCWHVLTDPKVIIYRTPFTQHISPDLKNLHWPPLWFSNLLDTLVLLCFSLFHPTFPSVWAFSCSTSWLWTFQTGSPHVIS